MTRNKILIAPLDWGLGHASRCVPIIHKLLSFHFDVQLGGSGLSGLLLQKEFPQLPYVEIPGYEVSYSNNLPMSIAMLRQAPGILRTIQQEKKWLDQFIQKHNIDAVISDHRYGLHNKKIYSVFVAHQLFISSGNSDMLEPVLWKINKSYIENFDTCWIPDMPTEPNASGKLSHKSNIPFKHFYIGIQSRLEAIIKAERKYKAAFILSGPEPLRTELEKKICSQLMGMNDGIYVMIRGTNENIKCQVPENLEIIDLADANTCNELLQKSELAVSRSGYSSIMDYLASGIKALVIPTPGQTEQEYLAEYHFENNHFYTVSQDNLNLQQDIPMANTYQSQFINNPKLLDFAIEDLIKCLN